MMRKRLVTWACEVTIESECEGNQSIVFENCFSKAVRMAYVHCDKRSETALPNNDFSFSLPFLPFQNWVIRDITVSVSFQMSLYITWANEKRILLTESEPFHRNNGVMSCQHFLIRKCGTYVSK